MKWFYNACASYSPFGMKIEKKDVVIPTEKLWFNKYQHVIL